MGTEKVVGVLVAGGVLCVVDEVLSPTGFRTRDGFGVSGYQSCAIPAFDAGTSIMLLRYDPVTGDVVAGRSAARIETIRYNTGQITVDRPLTTGGEPPQPGDFIVQAVLHHVYPERMGMPAHSITWDEFEALKP